MALWRLRQRRGRHHGYRCNHANAALRADRTGCGAKTQSKSVGRSVRRAEAKAAPGRRDPPIDTVAEVASGRCRPRPPATPPSIPWPKSRPADARVIEPERPVAANPAPAATDKVAERATPPLPKPRPAAAPVTEPEGPAAAKPAP